MASRFIQGDGYPILKRYNGSNVLQETVNLPYVRDDGSKSYIRQWFTPYPKKELLQHPLLSGTMNVDKPLGHNVAVEIKYSSIPAANLAAIYNCILDTMQNAGHYLKLTPRNDHNGTYKEYVVDWDGEELMVESSNMFQHNVILSFKGTELVSLSLTMEIPPVPI